MKRIISILLLLSLVFTCAAAEELLDDVGIEITTGGKPVDASIPTHLTVANSTKVSGSFFSRQFGNNTSDIDVRAMLHGYNPIVWDTQLTFVVDEQVVKSMDISNDAEGNTVYTFNLWDDLTWNDGTPMTAADYAFGFALEASQEFENISGDTDVWQHVVGYEEYSSKESKGFAGVRLLGDYSYSVTVKQEYLPYFYEYSYLYMMPCPISVIAPGCEVADDGEGVYIRNADSSIEEAIYSETLLQDTILDPEDGYLSYPWLTCGPYSLVSYDREEGIVEFHINEYFKGNYEGEKPVISDITLVPILPQEMAEKLASGEVDLINKVVDGYVIDDLLGVTMNGYFDSVNYARLGYGFIGLTCENGPQQFNKVRQAIAYAFDATDFVNNFLMGYGLQVYGFYGIGQWMTWAAMGVLRPEGATEEEMALWDACTLENLNHYDLDLDKALELLIEDGWTLNENGEEFNPDVDTVRYKKIENEAGEEELMRLSFDFGLIADNEAAQDVLNRLQTNLEPMGVEIIPHEDSFYNILVDYLREEGNRIYDMSFLAYNFVSIFDPLVEFSSDEDYPGSQNATAVYDEELIDLCWDLHLTEPLDVLTFEQRWIKFQERFNELLPTIPLYSNMYFDFFFDSLHGYDPDAEANWPRAILHSWIAEPDRTEGEFEIPVDDGDIIFID